MRVESTPTGKLDEAFDSIFWHSTPYTWPVIGYPSDVANITKAQADDYFATYYAPNNLTAVLVGDFDKAEALKLANEYFGRIPRGKVAPPEVITLPPKWEYDVRLRGRGRHEPAGRDPLAHRALPAQGLLRARGPRRAPERPDGAPLQVDGPPRRRRRHAGLAPPTTRSSARRSTPARSRSAPRRRKGRRPPRSSRRHPRRDRAAAEGARPRRRAPEGQEQHRGELVPPPLLELPDPRPAHGGRGVRRLARDERGAEEARRRHGGRRPARRADLPREGEPGDGALTRKAGAAASADDAALADVPEQIRPMIKQSLQRLAAETDAAKLKSERREDGGPGRRRCPPR